MLKSFKPASSIKGRAKDLIAKSFSIKVVVFVIGTGLLIWGKIDAWTWLALAGIVVTGRYLEKKMWLNNGK
jgi:hypothetical protein